MTPKWSPQKKQKMPQAKQDAATATLDIDTEVIS